MVWALPRAKGMVSPHPDTPVRSLSCAVLTISDTRSHDTDTSGALIRERLGNEGHHIIASEILPDDPAAVGAWVTTWVAHPQCEVIVTSGGTGIAPRDTTYEAIAHLLTQTLPGFGELFRMLSYAEIGSRAMASRAIAGVCQSTLVFAVPGSTKAVALALEKLILPELLHLTSQIRGGH